MRQETRDKTPGKVGGGAAGHAKLEAFQYADDLAVELFAVTRRLPPDLRWLSSQLLRAATSVPANIAEGYARSSRREFLQFLSISRASLAEVEYFIHFMHRTGLITPEQHARLSEHRISAAQRLHGFIKYVRSQVNAADKKKSAIYESTEEYVTDAES